MIRKIARALIGGTAVVAAAAPASACTPVSVYFAWGSASVAPTSLPDLERLAVTLAWKGPDLDHVLLAAHTDSSGSVLANRVLAMRRAEAVRAILIANHVPADLIEIRAMGEERPPVGTPANVREPANRRVDLILQLSARAQGAQLEDGRPIC